MRRVIAIAVILLAAGSSAAVAQSAASKPLAEVAKAEEARRQGVKKPAKVYTNGSLTADPMKGTMSSASATSSAGDTAAGAAAPAAGEASAAAEAVPEEKTQAFWANRISVARAQLQRSQMFADSLQSRINALLTDYVNRDDPAQKAKIEGDRKAALAELERVKKEVDAQGKAIAAIEEEARRAGVPPGWLRPGV